MLVGIYILATYEVLSGWVLTYDSVHSGRLYSVASLGNQAVGTMTHSYSHIVTLAAPDGADKQPIRKTGREKVFAS